MHTFLIVLGACLFIGAAICVAFAVSHSIELVSEVNEALPPEKQFSELGWGPIKRIRFWEVQKEVLPDSWRARLVWRLVAVWIMLFGLAILALFLSTFYGK